MDHDFPERDALTRVAASVLELAGSPEVGRAWDEPSALEGMTVGGLTAHLVVAVRNTLTLLARPLPDDPIVATPFAFFGGNRRDGDLDERAVAIAAGAEEAGAAGQDAVVAELGAVVDEVAVALAGRPGDELIATNRLPDAGSLLRDYVGTRVVELVVHGDDLAVSVGVVWNPPTPAVDVACRLFTDLARGRVGDLAVVRAFARAERTDPAVLRVL